MSIELLRTDENIDSIVNRYLPMIYRIALSNLKNKSDAEDITHDVILKYIKFKPDLSSEEHIKNWFIRVTVNMCKDFYKSSWIKRTIGFTDEDTISVDVRENADLKIDIHTALMKLPFKYRSIIHLFYYEDMTVEQISNVLGINLSTAKMRLQRGREKLKKILTENGGGSYEY